MTAAPTRLRPAVDGPAATPPSGAIRPSDRPAPRLRSPWPRRPAGWSARTGAGRPCAGGGFTFGAVLMVLAVLVFVPPSVGGTVPPVPHTTVRPAADPLPAAAPTRVRAPSIGLDGPIVPLGLDDHGALDVPRDGSVTGWYDGSPEPGRPGPSVLAAHVDWDHRPGPFLRLRDLSAGDVVEVDRADGTVATFEVQAVRRYPKDRFPTAEVYGDLPGPGLRLVTCGGSFDRGARSYRDNVVAYAALVQPGRGPT